MDLGWSLSYPVNYCAPVTAGFLKINMDKTLDKVCNLQKTVPVTVLIGYIFHDYYCCVCCILHIIPVNIWVSASGRFISAPFVHSQSHFGGVPVYLLAIAQCPGGRAFVCARPVLSVYLEK